MKKAVAALIGLALAAFVSVGFSPADTKSKTGARKSQASKLGHARKQPGNSRATSSKSSSQQNTMSLVASGTTKIAFASDRDGNLEIYTMDTDGGGLARLTENNAEDFSPAWSPDGTHIAFVSNRDGNPEIYVMNADGTSQTRLTNNTTDDLFPAWSPDGAKIAFSSRRDGNDEIYVMNPDGTGQQNITNNPGDDTQPTYSPDSTMIAFASNRSGNYDIFRMNSDGGNVIQLTFLASNDSNPNWSPTKITFQSDRDGDEEIYVMNSLDGSVPTNITNNSSAFDVEPFRTADGAKVAFASTRSGDFEIYLVSADGTGIVRLTNNPANDIQPALQLQGTIPAAGANTVQFSASNYTVNEGATIATVTVTRAGNTTGAATVDYTTGNGSANDRGDYTPALGTLRFAAGETSKSFTISIIDDAYIEPDESFNLTLRNPTGASLGSPSAATMTITDNDNTILSTNPNPIDNIPFFVRQQYLDFLGREPDPPGFAGWQSILNNCAFGDTSCDRIAVSSAFYRSPEFQDRGYFVYRFYDVAFARPPHYAEFVPDLARVSGFQTTAELEASKVAFINDFMSRTEFVNKYGALDSAGYVNTLVATAGVTLSNKQQLIDDLQAGRKTRAQVLREIVESVQVYQKFFNEAFVVMEYFGYLHRDPDILFLQWLDLLNRTGDFRTMVNGFVNSLEYRQRFGPP
ncbi:MAG TPA: Calx-beta domain-containing protein [Pyrinomonadaceae bacterium]